jgi:hypothetical protein
MMAMTTSISMSVKAGRDALLNRMGMSPLLLAFVDSRIQIDRLRLAFARIFRTLNASTQALSV